MTYFMKDENGIIQIVSAEPFEGSEVTEESIVQDYRGCFVFESETLTAEYQEKKQRATQFYKCLEQIDELKLQLKNTDYQAIKYAEGEMSAEEYSIVKEQRRLWRAEINRLEREAKQIEGGVLC